MAILPHPIQGSVVVGFSPEIPFENLDASLATRSSNVFLCVCQATQMRRQSLERVDLDHQGGALHRLFDQLFVVAICAGEMFYS